MAESGRGPAGLERMTEIVNTQTPPILHAAPSEKEMRYDRQLRLWAKTGQAALESANILLANFGCGVVGIEALKNLVLPGIGRLVIYDEHTVEWSDLGMNFFLDESCLGKPRASSCVKFLRELNPDVNSDWFPKSKNDNLKSILESSPTFTMIILALPAKEECLKPIEEYGQRNRTPIIYMHSAGFYAYFRINLQGTFPIVDTHPDAAATTDLRLLEPWQEQTDYFEELTRGMEELDDSTHAHIPYPAILFHYLRLWRQSHGGKNPESFKEKLELRKLVDGGTRRGNAEGGEENFEEATAAVTRTITKPSLPSSLQEVFDRLPQELSKSPSTFWMIAAGIKDFYEEHHRLPVTGAVPDMKARPDVYLRLKKIYQDQAEKDAKEVLSRSLAICKLDSPDGGPDMEEAEMFCKNAAFVKLVNARSQNPNRLRQVVEQEMATNAEMSLMPVYLALLAIEKDTEPTVASITSAMLEVSPHISLSPSADAIVMEVQRVARDENHNVSALMGGLVAQEMIKIITKQYIPVDNTCIYDGIQCRCQTLAL